MRERGRKRGFLIEGAVKELSRNRALGMFPRILKKTPTKTPSDSGQGV